MPPRHHTLRPAQTASAREAMRAFFCDLCQKGYTRMNEYEAHLSSYDHSHKQRLKDMKAMVRDPAAAARARRQEAKDAAISTAAISTAADNGKGGADHADGATARKPGGFRKGGFKSAFVEVAGTAVQTDAAAAAATVAEPSNSTTWSSGEGTVPSVSGLRSAARDNEDDGSAESDTGDEGYELYDPSRPTD